MQSEEKYRNLVETSDDLIWSVDFEGRFTFGNSASKYTRGYEPINVNNAVMAVAELTDAAIRTVLFHQKMVLDLDFRSAVPSLTGMAGIYRVKPPIVRGPNFFNRVADI